METMTNGVMPVFDMADRGKEDGMGGSWIWIILLFFLFGGKGFGNNGAESTAAMGQINNDFLYTNLNSSIDQGFNQLANQNFGLSKELCQGFGGVQTSFQNLGAQMASCC